MKFFRVHLCDTDEGSAGYRYETNEPAARRIVAEFKRDLKARVRMSERPAESSCDIDTIEIEPNKAGILKALNRYAGHPNNG